MDIRQLLIETLRELTGTFFIHSPPEPLANTLGNAQNLSEKHCQFSNDLYLYLHFVKWFAKHFNIEFFTINLRIDEDLKYQRGDASEILAQEGDLVD